MKHSCWVWGIRTPTLLYFNELWKLILQKV